MDAIEYEHRVQQALIDIKQNPRLSLRAASRKRSVVASTVSARRSGVLSRIGSLPKNAKLTAH